MQLSSAQRRLLADPFNRSSNVAQPARGLGKGGDGERGGLGSFDGVEEGCSGSKPAAEVSHGIEVPRDARASRGDRSILASTMLIGLIEVAHDWRLRLPFGRASIFSADNRGSTLSKLPPPFWRPRYGTFARRSVISFVISAVTMGKVQSAHHRQ